VAACALSPDLATANTRCSQVSDGSGSSEGVGPLRAKKKSREREETHSPNLNDPKGISVISRA
jgi:hypothetical protein